MKNLFKISAPILFIFLSFTFLVKPVNVQADWWQRPTEGPTPTRIPLPTHPGEYTPTPTTQVNPSPTNDPSVTSQPTPTGINAPTPTPTNGVRIGGTEDDPCSSGKSYSGPYCGWSPDHDTKSNTSSNVSSTISVAPKVLGLSRTSGPELTVSDIMLFAGLLCLALYLKSKISVKPGNRFKT